MKNAKLLIAIVGVAVISASCNGVAQTTVTTTGTLTKGYPILGNGTSTVLAVPEVIDATLQAGADMCAKINASWTILEALGTLGGVVDARGFNGTQTCAGSMWSNVTGGFAATLLTAGVNIQTSVSQVRPTNTSWYSYGHATTTPYANLGTSLQPSSSFPSNTPVEQWGSSAAVSNVQDHNIRISCLPPSGTAITGSIGVLNQWAQENSTLDNVTIDGCNNAGLDIETSNSQNSGPYNVNISENHVTNSGAVGIRIGNASGSVLYPLRAISGTINGYGASGAEVGVGIAIDFASGIDLTDIHCEQYVTCVEIGANHLSHGVHIANLECSSVSAMPITTCLDISASGASESITAENIFAPSLAYVTNVLADHLTHGCTIPVSTEQTVALYVRGEPNSVFAPGNTSCTNYFTTPIGTP